MSSQQMVSSSLSSTTTTLTVMLQWMIGKNCSKKVHPMHLYWILISLNIFIGLAYCDDDIITPSTQSLPQKRSGGKYAIQYANIGICLFSTSFNSFVYFLSYFSRLLAFVRLILNAVLTGSALSSTGILDVKDHCNKTVEIYEDVSSPDLTNANRNRPLLCTYRFRSFRGAPRDWVLRIRFKKFKVGNILNATHCDGGYLQVCQSFSRF